MRGRAGAEGGAGSSVRARVTYSGLLIVLGPAIAFAISGVDPLMLTLNLSQVSRGLAVPANLVGFLGGAATLVVAAAVLAVGNLGDRYGLKTVLMYGLGANLAVNLGAGLSPDYQFLIVMRLLDGATLAALLGLTLALLRVSVPDPMRPAAIGIFMAIDTVLYGVTPLIGGWVVATFGWRWLFLVAPPLALAALILTARYVPAVPRRPGHRLDITGIILVGVALLGLVYGIGNVPGGISQPQSWVPLLLCGLAAGAFLWWEWRVPDPALDPGLFRRGAFTVAVLAITTVNFLAAGLGIVLGQFGGAVLSLSAQAIGLLYLPGTLLLAGASIAAGRLVARRTARPVLITGLLVATASGLILAAAASPHMALWVLVIATWTANLGYFVSATPVSETILSSAPPGKAGAVAAVQPTFGMAGYALGPAIYLLLLNLFFAHEWQTSAESQGLSVERAQHTVNAVTSSLANSPGAAGYDPSLLRQASSLGLTTDYTNGLRLTMLVVSILPLMVALLAWFRMPRGPERAS